ncbi:hypothetical protein LINPERHAP2_LOCUS16808 [Linum perenne]
MLKLWRRYLASLHVSFCILKQSHYGETCVICLKVLKVVPCKHGLALQCHDATVQYCTYRLLEITSLFASTLKEKSRSHTSENLHNIKDRFTEDIFNVLRHMALALCRSHDSEALTGLQWVLVTFPTSYSVYLFVRFYIPSVRRQWFLLKAENSSKLENHLIKHFDAFGTNDIFAVKVDDYLLCPPTSRVKAHEVRSSHAVFEHRMENVSTDGLSWFHNERSWNNVGTEEFLWDLDYNPIDDLMGSMHEPDNILSANEISREYEDIVVADKSFEASNHVRGISIEELKCQSPGFGTSNNVDNCIGSAESTTTGVLDAHFKTRICPPEMHQTRLDFQVTTGYVKLGNSECCDQENLGQIDTKPSTSLQEDKKNDHCSCSPRWKISGKRFKKVIKNGQ